MTLSQQLFNRGDGGFVGYVLFQPDINAAQRRFAHHAIHHGGVGHPYFDAVGGRILVTLDYADHPGRYRTEEHDLAQRLNAEIAEQSLPRVFVNDHFLQRIAVIEEVSTLYQLEAANAQVIAAHAADRRVGRFAAKANVL
ncbi:hypothetical protein D3C80_546880 [compost metagenome]